MGMLDAMYRLGGLPFPLPFHGPVGPLTKQEQGAVVSCTEELPVLWSPGLGACVCLRCAGCRTDGWGCRRPRWG